ncbi:MAG: HD-GYP domain-containing protein [Lachnospiraceae bacterium]|nr:HD-GYP domain-containing protein [Lachnospiraceae bacterium]
MDGETTVLRENTAHVNNAYLNNQKELLFKSKRVEANKIVSKAMRIILLLFLLIWILNAVGLYKMDITLTTLCFASCGFFMMVPTLLINVLDIQKEYVDYVVVLCTVLVVGILCTFLSSFMYAFLPFPLFIAAMYSNKRVVTFTAISSVIMTVIANILGYTLNFSPVEFIHFSCLQDVFLFSILPSTAILIAISVIAFYIVDRNFNMLNNAIDSDIETKKNQKELIFSFAEISENKSKMTGEHIKRVAEYCRVLGKASGFTDEYVEKLATAAMMHDIGKLMIDENILDKTSRLTDEEYAIMKNHVLYGEALLHNTTGELLELARVVALQHHEKWDGTGYLGMKGTEIAYPARIVALADVFDALMSTRYYKEGWSLDEAYEEIVRCSGTHFDPDVVFLFIQHFEDFKRIVRAIPDQQIY